MSALTVYSRQGCHLCEQLIEELLPLVRDQLDIEVIDVDSRDDWRRKYDARVPVIEFDGRFVCEFSLDRDAVMRIIAELGDSSSFST
ncbi:MAG: glutaredoxin family protein [Proteobacteria bacterium]|nr:glutaredoxin family protein [Pseudomonadota bacterium]